MMKRILQAGVSRGRQYLIFLALVVINLSAQLVAFGLRFEFSVPSEELINLRWGLAGAILLKLPLFYLTRLHRGWIHFSGLRDLKRVLVSATAGSLAFVGGIYWIQGAAFPRSVYVLDYLLTVAGVCAVRVLVRTIRELNLEGGDNRPVKRVLIYGAGTAGTQLAREIQSNSKLGLRVCGFLDDAPHLARELVLGLPILGCGSEAVAVIDKLRKRGTPVDEILVAIPSCTREKMARILGWCAETGLPTKTLPGLGDLIKTRHLSLQVRDINLEDLLCRETVVLDEDNIRASITGKCVMITGAAGSIGSELARCITRFNPARLILFDIAESPLHQIDLMLAEAKSRIEIHSILGDIRDYAQVDAAIRYNRVTTIFHAAAYKHVPIMEEHAVQAAANNILGTYNLAEAAHHNGVESFTLISTDKAVNPTSIMGATKRAAELLVLSYKSQTKFTAVRFGNVLGSNGSVVPTFQMQIARGGPVLVTHPEVTRYFMTVREAVQLVLQASSMSKGGDVFVLDMGQPVRILDLAHHMIRLAGLRPEVDIKIEFTGLRPGEKLHEELIAEGESIAPTYHEKIKIFTGPVYDHQKMETWIDELYKIVLASDDAGVARHLTQLIADYQVSDRWSPKLRMPSLRAVPAPRTRAMVGR